MKMQSVQAVFQRLSHQKMITAMGLFLMVPRPAFAQIEKLNSVMTMVQTALLSIAVVAFTIAILWAGYKMAFQHAKWSEVANIVIGGVFVGGAAAIATLLVGTV